ncbi:membrane lipoprotein lipid attachment site-containing protein [Dysgonomonas sp. 25]|uniref:membrane lipoprotein lipid attachment site-containing protein n=1 Tax=Dysgonomonas sp. 25 TaxID=2302933 RepID=UPI0013D44564|nr:membrane lipoprotein lipid attachment site-containing protein [Dysgonomonas sp. 25]
MKKMILFLSAVLLLASCQKTMAQPSPAISTKYSDTEIEKMIRLYHSKYAQDVAPSGELSARFVADFPNARDVEWEMAQNIYEVDFEIGHVDYEAYYDKEGNLLSYSFEIYESDLPAVVKNATIAKYPDYVFEDMTRIYKGTKILYKVEIEREKNVELLVLDNGTIIKEKND